MSDDDNVFQFGSVKGGKDAEDTIPVNRYVVTDIQGDEFYEEGFLIFTPHHCAIMRDFGKGAIPLLVVPLIRVKSAEMLEDDDEEATLI